MNKSLPQIPKKYDAIVIFLMIMGAIGGLLLMYTFYVDHA